MDQGSPSLLSEAIFAATEAFMLRAMGDVRLSAIAGEVDGLAQSDA